MSKSIEPANYENRVRVRRILLVLPGLHPDNPLVIFYYELFGYVSDVAAGSQDDIVVFIEELYLE